MGTLGFPKRNRLLARREFLACYERGRRLQSGRFIVYALSREKCEPWRLGLAVTKKVGPAAQRNRIKRVLREFFRLHQHELSAPMDIVIVPKRHVDAKSLGLAQVESELAPMLARVGILTPALEADHRGEVQGGG